MAGSISLSLSQQFDELGEPLNGGTLQFYAAGTTTPQSAYQDAALTLAYPNPIVLDSAGRIPPFYLADGQIKIVLKNAGGVVQISADNLLVIGASSGTGSPPTVDASTVLATGDIKVRYGTGVLTGFVRANGRTIGSSTSGATEYANAAAQDLFEYLWGADANLTVSTGRGSTANDDWVANKTIALPDVRGRVIAGLDDMGNSAASRLTSTYFGTSAIVLGAAGGSESTTLSLAQLPTGITSTGNVTGTTGNLVTANGQVSTFSTSAGGATSWLAWATANVVTVISSLVSTGTLTSNNTSGNPHRTVPPMMLATIYLKL